MKTLDHYARILFAIVILARAMEPPLLLLTVEQRCITNVVKF
jgi:hypothetical protein